MHDPILGCRVRCSNPDPVQIGIAHPIRQNIDSKSLAVESKWLAALIVGHSELKNAYCDDGYMIATREIYVGLS